MTRSILTLLVAGLCLVPLASARADDLVLADGGQSAYRIVVADDASPSTRHGAEELQMFLQQITGAKLPIVSDREPLGAAEVILGDNAHLRQLGVQIDFQELGHEGYVLRVVGKHLVIAGGALRGNLYGVYGLLEDHLGCRWFAPDVSRIPQTQRLVLGPIDQKQVPVLEYREPFTFDCFDGDWCARNRVNSQHRSIGGKARRQDHVRVGLLLPHVCRPGSAGQVLQRAPGSTFRWSAASGRTVTPSCAAPTRT